MPVTTAAITSRRARRARRRETSKYYFPSSQVTQPRSHSELVNSAAFHCYDEESSCCRKAQERAALVNCVDILTKKHCVVTFEGDVSTVNMEEGEAQTLAMTHSNPGSGSRTMSASSSNESSPTTTRAPGLGGSNYESPQGIERSFKRRRSFSKSEQSLDNHCS